jgi:hypothetical protein
MIMSNGELEPWATINTGSFPRQLRLALCVGAFFGALDVVWYRPVRTDRGVNIIVSSGHDTKPVEMSFLDALDSRSSNPSDGVESQQYGVFLTAVENTESRSNQLQKGNNLPYSPHKKNQNGKSITPTSLEFPPGFKPHPNVYSEVYLKRCRHLDETDQKQIADKWGSWTFADPMVTATPEKLSFKSKDRPRDDYYVNYPSRDVPRGQFPPNAWQTDEMFLSQFLPEAQALVLRSMEGILTEYGHGKDQEPDRSLEQRSDMFLVRVSNNTSAGALLWQEGDASDAGGFMSEKAYNGLGRRVLHAIMTEDTFRVVTGGHSAAAGHGNHFQQSYTLQIQRVLEPIFARLGVTMTAHCLGMGSMGTIQNAIGMRDLYGGDIDVLIYDSGYVASAPSFPRESFHGANNLCLCLQNNGNSARCMGLVHATGNS